MRRKISWAESVQAAAEDRMKRGIGTAIEAAQARQAAVQARLVMIQATGAAQNAYLTLISQIFAPKDKEYVALEPMTAPTNALTSGCGLQLVNPGGAFRAAFRIRIDTAQ